MNTIGGDVVKLTASKVITALVSLASAMLLSRFRTLEEYGTYSQLLLVINLFSSIFMLGLPNSINYFLARAETQEEKHRFLSIYYTVSTFLSLVLGAALVCATPLIESYFANQTVRSFVYFLALFPWASIVSSSIENVLIVYRKAGFLFFYKLLNSLCLLGIILLVQIMKWNFSTYMKLYLLVYSCFAVLVYIISSRLCGALKLCIDVTWLKRILGFSVPMGLASVVGTISVEMDKLLIGRVMDTAQLAIYTNAAKELPVTMVASAITAVLLPQLTRMIKRGDNKKAIALWKYSTELSYIIICFIVAGVFTYAKDVMTLLYSEKYLSGISVFRVYTLVLLLRCTYYGMVLNAIGKSKDIFYCSIASLLLNAVLNVSLYLMLGMIGPAIGTFISIFIIQLLQLYLTSKNVNVTFKNVYPWKRIVVVTLINFVLSFVFLLIKYILHIEKHCGSVFESILLGLIWGVLYFIIMRKRGIKLWHLINAGGTEI